MNERKNYSEELDVHPIFRENTFLIEEGTKLVKGEAYVDESLKHIDIHLVDKNKTNLYVEIEWNSFDKEQQVMYLNLLKKRYGEIPFRFMCFVPNDMIIEEIPQEIEIKRFSSEKVIRLIEIRRTAKKIINDIIEKLQTPVVLPRGIMHREEITFPNIILACYFEGILQTDKGLVKVGLRKQAIGRYLDLIRCVCQSHFVDKLPELTILFLYELMISPYYFRSKDGRDNVDPKGFYNHIYRHRTSIYYKTIAKVVIEIQEKIENFVKSNLSFIKLFYLDNTSYYDIQYRILLELPQNIYEMNMINPKKLIEHLIKVFNLHPSTVVPRIKHNLTNQWVDNKYSPEGSEVDMAKRIIEIATLKRMLLPITGVPIMRILVSRRINNNIQYMRMPIQNFYLNKNKSLIEPILKDEQYDNR